MPVIIKCKNPGFRRAGAPHPAEATYPDGHWSPEQLAILQAETMLTVEIVDADKDNKSQGSTPASRPNVADTLAIIKAAVTLDDLNKLAEGEDRKSVLPAIEARRAELQA